MVCNADLHPSNPVKGPELTARISGQSFWVPTTGALYWTDGKRNLAEVIKLTELEMGQSIFPG
jgi:hypothetical protein